MCIRDRVALELDDGERERLLAAAMEALKGPFRAALDRFMVCLLYTSDAADERSSVDLGGRRIIKKKKKVYSREGVVHSTTSENETSRQKRIR